MERADVGLAGLTVAGRNLVLCLARRGYRAAVFDRAPEVAEAFVQGEAQGLGVTAATSLSELAGMLKPPRRILLAFNSDAEADAAIDALISLLETGDIILDGGDSWYENTARREKALASKGIRFMGVGLAFGAEGAANGFCVMPGGSKETLLASGRVFTDIAARVDSFPCCAWVGPGGSGHFVKAAHDGIKAAVLQLIAESYALMRELLGMTAEETQAIFRLWNSREMNSHLLSITCDILGNTDPLTDHALVDEILDEAAFDASAALAGMQALGAGSPAPTIAAAVSGRAFSALKKERVVASRIIGQDAQKPNLDKYAFIDDIGHALYAAAVSAWAQGFALLRAGSLERGWNLKPVDIARIWRGGALRSGILERTREAMEENPMLANLMVAPAFRKALEEAQGAWRNVVSTAALAGVPVGCMASALSYLDSYRSAQLPANLTQAQLDYMGEQTYRRVDKPGEFHTEWDKGQ